MFRCEVKHTTQRKSSHVVAAAAMAEEPVSQDMTVWEKTKGKREGVCVKFQKKNPKKEGGKIKKAPQRNGANKG